MEVKSKFNKGDTIFFMSINQIQIRKITGISFFTGKSKKIDGSEKSTVGDFAQVDYHTDDSFEVAQQDAFASKDDLLKHLSEGAFDGEYSPFTAPVKSPKLN